MAVTIEQVAIKLDDLQKLSNQLKATLDTTSSQLKDAIDNQQQFTNSIALLSANVDLITNQYERLKSQNRELKNSLTSIPKQVKRLLEIRK